MPKPAPFHDIMIQTNEVPRAAEALRNAVGLTLRGARVRVFFAGNGVQLLSLIQEPSLAKPLTMLLQLGHELYTEPGGPEIDDIEICSFDIIREKLKQGKVSSTW